MSKRVIIASTSTLHQQSYLEYLLPKLEQLFKGVNELIFVPYARPGGISYDDYTKVITTAFKSIKIDVKGIHEFDNRREAIKNAQAIFVGGGNSFELVNQLYRTGLLEEIKNVVESGIPYLGTSAGSNITGLSIKTTNDMPIVYPPSFDTMGLINFNINPHYLDSDPTSTHMGETREIRIKEFHKYNDEPVLGLREGSWLELFDEELFLRGNLTARLFEKDKEPRELKTNSDISFINELI
ncbi:dipeptidase PepE [Urechidicola sp. KH5]